MITLIPPIRNDSRGSGHFGAPRGGRDHNGVDISAPVNSIVISPVTGVFTKYGYCYRDDPEYRYVEVVDREGCRHRFFYTKPLHLEIGDEVIAGDRIAVAQDIAAKYGAGMINHVHYEIIKNNTFINPEVFWS